MMQKKKCYFNNSSMAAILNCNALWGVQGVVGKRTKRLCMGFCEFLVGESPKAFNCLGGTVGTTLRCPSWLEVSNEKNKTKCKI